MAVLYHYPLCPHSRFIRLIMAELGMEATLEEENVFARRHDFLVLNPAGTLPVLVEHDGLAIPGAEIIAEYLDETRGLVLDDRRLLPEDPASRVEVRRLIQWFSTKFFEEVTHHLLTEKIYKRLLPVGEGGGAPDPSTLRVAATNIRYHLKYLSHLVHHRNWLAGDRLTYADLMAAAQLSVIDYVGDVPWAEEEGAKQWYARVKSRPSFRPLLAERMRGLLPVGHYADLDF